MKRLIGIRYCFRILWLINYFFLDEQEWNQKQQQLIQTIIRYTKKDGAFFVRYTRILYFFMGNDSVKKRWEDTWLNIFTYLYKNDIPLFEIMLACLEKSVFNVQKAIGFPEVYKTFLNDKLKEENDSLNKLIKVCRQEKYGNIKRKTIRYSIEVFANWACFPQDKKRLLQECDEYLRKETDYKNKIALLHLIGEGKCMTPSFLEIYCNLIYHCGDAKIKYYYGVYELAWLIFRHPKIIYENYYIERRKFLGCLVEDMWKEHKESIKKKQEDSRDRIAILVNGLHGKLYASARLEIYLANELARQGYKVTIFVADSNWINGDFDNFLNPSGTRRTSSTMYKSEHRRMIEKGVSIKYNPLDNYDNMFFTFLKDIYEYNPDFIVDILDQQAFFDYILIKDYPIIKVPLAGMPPACAEFDVFLARDLNALRIFNKTYDAVDEKKAIEGNLYIPYNLRTIKIYSRRKLHIKKDDFVIVTVGNRLITDINYEFAKEMARILEKHNDIKWIVVGIWRNEYECLEKFIRNGHIINEGFVNELPALYKLCDIFMNPIRSGGGGSIAMFIQSGRPAIISSDPSDILPYVGKENCVNGDLPDMFEAMERIYYDRNIGKELAERQRKNLMDEKFSVKNYAETIIEQRSKICR